MWPHWSCAGAAPAARTRSASPKDRHPTFPSPPSPTRPWLELSLLAGQLLSWTRSLCLEGDLSQAGPKRIASACCTLPGGSPARRDARRCGCFGPGLGPRLWLSQTCGRCRWRRARSHRIRASHNSARHTCQSRPARERPPIAPSRQRPTPEERRSDSEEPPRRCYLRQVARSHPARWKRWIEARRNYVFVLCSSHLPLSISLLLLNPSTLVSPT